MARKTLTIQLHYDGMEASLRELADRLLVLPDLLRERGIDNKILEHPRIPLGHMPEALANWGLS